VDRNEFKEKLKAIGITQKKFASITGQGYSTVKNWNSIPQWVEVMVRYMEVISGLKNIDTTLHRWSKLHDQIKI